jgi:hypothetical protein
MGDGRPLEFPPFPYPVQTSSTAGNGNTGNHRNTSVLSVEESHRQDFPFTMLQETAPNHQQQQQSQDELQKQQQLRQLQQVQDIRQKLRQEGCHTEEWICGLTREQLLVESQRLWPPNIRKFQENLRQEGGHAENWSGNLPVEQLTVQSQRLQKLREQGVTTEALVDFKPQVQGGAFTNCSPSQQKEHMDQVPRFEEILHERQQRQSTLSQQPADPQTQQALNEEVKSLQQKYSACQEIRQQGQYLPSKLQQPQDKLPSIPDERLSIQDLLYRKNYLLQGDRKSRSANWLRNLLFSIRTIDEVLFKRLRHHHPDTLTQSAQSSQTKAPVSEEVTQLLQELVAAEKKELQNRHAPSQQSWSQQSPIAQTQSNQLSVPLSQSQCTLTQQSPATQATNPQRLSRVAYDTISHVPMTFQHFASDAEQERLWQGDEEQRGDRHYFQRLKHPVAQATAYFADAFNNTSWHHGYYPPASYHVTNVGNEAAVVIGNAVFYSYGKSKPEDERQDDEQQDIDWMAMAACGYPGEDVKNYARK